MNHEVVYLWMKQVIEITNPKVFIAENVKGLISLGDAKSIIEKDFRSIGDGFLVVPAKVLKATDYGVAQTRERVIFIGLNKTYLKADMIKKIEKGKFDIHPPAPHIQNQSTNTWSLMRQYAQYYEVLRNPSSLLILLQTKYSKAKYCKGSQGQVEVNLMVVPND